MLPPPAEHLKADETGIARAADLLRQGLQVAFPTETVYGLGADAQNAAAVAGVFAAKGRPTFNPLIVHVADLAGAQAIAKFDEIALTLAQNLWPGPLTLVLPLRADAGISDLVTAGLPTIAIRVPKHSLAQRLLADFGGGIAAPSANPSGKVSPTRADHVLEELGDKISAVLDGGPCPVGVESTIVGFDPDPILLREGGVSAEDLATVLGHPIGDRHPTQGQVTAPGQLVSHYATNAGLRLNAQAAKPGEVMLGFGAVAGDLNLSPTADLTEAAANLFEYLRELDKRPNMGIAVAPIPSHGLGAAINDRLGRAAAERP